MYLHPFTKDNINVARQLIDMLNDNPIANSFAVITMATLPSKDHDYDHYNNPVALTISSMSCWDVH